MRYVPEMKPAVAAEPKLVLEVAADQTKTDRSDALAA